MTAEAQPTDSLAAQAQFFHDAFAHWLAQPGVTIACGRWADGAISECYYSLTKARSILAHNPGWQVLGDL